MIETRITITHPVGLHARPASLFVQQAAKFKSKITVENLNVPGKPVDARSILGVLTLGVLCGHEIHLRADGPDEAEALQALQTLVASNFGEA